MNMQSLAAVAAVVDLAVILSACAAGFLLARGTRIPGWAAAIAMLLVIRAVSMMLAHAMEAPSADAAFPIIDVAFGGLALGCLTLELRRARRDAAPASSITSTVAPDYSSTASEEHADAA